MFSTNFNIWCRFRGNQCVNKYQWIFHPIRCYVIWFLLSVSPSASDASTPASTPHHTIPYFLILLKKIERQTTHQMAIAKRLYFKSTYGYTMPMNSPVIKNKLKGTEIFFHHKWFSLILTSNERTHIGNEQELCSYWIVSSLLAV